MMLNLGLSLINDIRIGSFFSYKDKLLLTMQSSLVFNYRCVRCTSDYVDSTVLQLVQIILR